MNPRYSGLPAWSTVIGVLPLLVQRSLVFALTLYGVRALVA